MCVALESPEGSLDVFYTFLSRGGARVHRLGEVSGHSQRRPGLTRGRDPLASECERGVFGASGLSVATTRRSRGFYPTIPVIDRCFFRGKSQPRARSVDSTRATRRATGLVRGRVFGRAACACDVGVDSPRETRGGDGHVPTRGRARARNPHGPVST